MTVESESCKKTLLYWVSRESLSRKDKEEDADHGELGRPSLLPPFLISAFTYRERSRITSVEKGHVTIRTIVPAGFSSCEDEREGRKGELDGRRERKGGRKGLLGSVRS